MLLLAGCGERAARPGGAPSPRTSAFRFRTQPDDVRHDVPLEQVRQGVPGPDPRDRIRALRRPEHVAASGARDLRDDDRVLALVVGEEAVAYPVHVLDAHELVNDRVGGLPVLVTWCPLCRSAMAFERVVAGEERTFGVSGYLYRSAVLMYDHASETFWSQIAARAVVGPLTGERLVERPVTVLTWAGFCARHPQGRVLALHASEDLGAAAYRQDRYGPYHASRRLMFEVDAYDRRLELKDEVLGVVRGGVAHAWSLAHLRGRAGETPAPVGGEALRLRYDSATDAAEVLDAAGEPVPSLRCSWFAWYAFHPDTGLTGGRVEGADAPGTGSAGR